MSMRGWLFTILKNTSINVFRKKAFTRNLVISDYNLSNSQLNFSASRNTGEGNCIIQDIQQSITLLSPVYKAVFSYFVEGYKYHEIAQMMNIPIGTVKFRIHAARIILQRQLNMYHKANS